MPHGFLLVKELGALTELKTSLLPVFSFRSPLLLLNLFFSAFIKVNIKKKSVISPATYFQIIITFRSLFITIFRKTEFHR
jgi:hypothetical protein